MNYDLQDSDLSTVVAEGHLIADETMRAFGPLSAQQINWTPRPGEWSIGQCFDHLIISNRPYFQIVEAIREGRRRQRAWERMPILPRFFGKLIINTLRPDSGRKAKARPAFSPSTSHIAPGIISSFLEQQDGLIGERVRHYRGTILDRDERESVSRRGRSLYLMLIRESAIVSACWIRS
jgi:hypothetical protein